MSEIAIPCCGEAQPTIKDRVVMNGSLSNEICETLRIVESALFGIEPTNDGEKAPINTMEGALTDQTATLEDAARRLHVLVVRLGV